MTPGLTTLSLGLFLWYCACYCLTCLSGRPSHSGKDARKWGVRSKVVLDTCELAEQGREDTCEQSEAEQHTIRVSPLSAHLH